MMVEQGMGGEQLRVQSDFHPYPPPLATYEDVVGSTHLFMDTLSKFHASMGTKFMIPVVGGRDLDLHQLFVQVTSRGGIAKVLKDKRWKEVTSTFSFPSSATNASFILRKYYVSLLYHYEQAYLFKAKCWTPSPTDTMQQLSANISGAHRSSEYGSSIAQQTLASATSVPQVHQPPPPAGSPVCGVIDGKFDSGYLITVKIGAHDYKGVLYQVPAQESQAFSTHRQLHQGGPMHLGPAAAHARATGGTSRRKRRKKSEIRKRDPSHPKPNRSGYNFFFAEQHAKLKPLYHGKDREISRIIGETWNKLTEPERAVYQEKALKDKERYKIEMEDYRERLRTDHMVRATFPMPPCLPPPAINLNDLDPNLLTEGPFADDYKVGSAKSSCSEDESLDLGESSHAENELKNVDIEVMADDEAFDFRTRLEKSVPNEGSSGRDVAQKNREDGVSVRIEEYEERISGSGNEEA